MRPNPPVNCKVIRISLKAIAENIEIDGLWNMKWFVWKVYVFEIVLVHIFRKDRKYLSVFSLSAWKYGPEQKRIRTIFTPRLIRLFRSWHWWKFRQNFQNISRPLGLIKSWAFCLQIYRTITRLTVFKQFSLVLTDFLGFRRYFSDKYFENTCWWLLLFSVLIRVGKDYRKGNLIWLFNTCSTYLLFRNFCENKYAFFILDIKFYFPLKSVVRHNNFRML